MNEAPWQPQKIARSRPPRVVDDFAPRPRAAAASTPVHRPAPAVQRHEQHPESRTPKPVPHPPPSAGLSLADQMLERANIKPHSRLASYVQVVVVIVAAAVAGLVFQSLPLGEIAIAAYGIIALARSIASRTTFILALVALGIVPVLMLIGQPFLSENFATYAFILLIVAILSVLKEVYRGRKSSGIP